MAGEERYFDSLIEEFLDRTGDARPVLVLLEGDLGVGKTTFVKELLRYWGYSAQVQSPSFLKLLEHQVPDVGLCLHLDCYRIDEADDFDRLSLESYLHAAYWFVEWPEIFLKHLTERPDLKRLLGFGVVLRLRFVMDDAGGRLVEIV